MKMKCLLLSSEYPPKQGGVGNASFVFSQEMALRGWSIIVITNISTGLCSKEFRDEAIVHRVNLKGSLDSTQPITGEIEKFARIIYEFEPDVIVIHGWQGWPIKSLTILTSYNKPIFLQSHGFGAHRVPWNYRPAFGIWAWSKRLPFIFGMPNLLKQIRALSVLSKNANFRNAFDHWVAEKFGCDNVLTIPNGVYKIAAEKSFFLKAYPHLKNKFLILNVANFCDRKNQLKILEIAKCTKNLDIHFVLIGSEKNTYAHTLEALATQWGVENRVEFIYGVPREMTESAIMASDIAIMTSKWEMQPLFLLEAMSVGKPWISTNVGCVSELKGGIISSMNTQKIIENITTLLQDTERRNFLSRAGMQQWKMEFAPSVVYDSWHKLLLLSANSQNESNACR